MTVTAIITRIGVPRVFDVSTTTGGTKKVNTVEVAMRSGNQNYLGEAFDDVMDYIFNNGHEGDMIVAELFFSIREFTTKDGNKAYAQKTTVTNAQIVNPHF